MIWKNGRISTKLNRPSFVLRLGIRFEFVVVAAAAMKGEKNGTQGTDDNVRPIEWLCVKKTVHSSFQMRSPPG
jgi:hypothetical protein